MIKSAADFLRRSFLFIYTYLFYIYTYLFPSEDAHHDEEITQQTDGGCPDDSARREDVWIKGLLCAAVAIHQGISCRDEEDGGEKDAVARKKGAYKAVF